MCTSADILDKYKKYLDNLAQTNSSELFSNGGKEYASILMSVLLEHTQYEARIFCEGFKPDLISTEPYFSALKKYLEDKNKKLKVLIETKDYIDEEPFKLLKKTRKERCDESISFKCIKEDDKKNISETLNNSHCNFAIFDSNKFRLEYDPSTYKAFGSFNHSENCKILIDLFDTAFENASSI